MNIIKSLSNDSDLKDLSRDIIELVIDEGLKEGLLKEIPIVKTVYSLYKAYNTITDKIHLKKVLMVLLEMKDLTNEERADFIEELKDKYSSGTDSLMLAISNLETYPKCVVFGRLSLLKATGQITLDAFKRITKMIQDCYLEDMKILQAFNRKRMHYGQEMSDIDTEGIPEEYLSSFVSLRILVQLLSPPSEITKEEHSNDRFKGGETTFNYYFSNEGQVLFDNYSFLFKDIG